MKLLPVFTSTVAALTLSIGLTGLPGVAHSQVGYADYDYAPYYNPYNDPFYNPPGPYYDSHYYPRYGTYYNPCYDDIGQLTDTKLRYCIKRDLMASPFVDREDIHVRVDNGTATLSGSVEDRSAMIDAVEIAYDAGASKVRNKLRPRARESRPWADMRDSELKAEIEDELDFSPFVNADQIRVKVRDGVATLYGGVENEGEIADAVENAYEAGAKRVRSKLWVDHELS
ncbi:BON domain-containing protein [Candidatus Nitrospira salsa]|nr:MAG: hypothetical protein NPIRA01_01630 [Nitrospirales bacterium]